MRKPWLFRLPTFFALAFAAFSLAGFLATGRTEFGQPLPREGSGVLHALAALSLLGFSAALRGLLRSIERSASGAPPEADATRSTLAFAGGVAASVLLLVAAAAWAAGGLSGGAGGELRALASVATAFAGLPGAVFAGASSLIFASTGRGAGTVTALFGALAALAQALAALSVLANQRVSVYDFHLFDLAGDGPSMLFAVFVAWVLGAGTLSLNLRKDPYLHAAQPTSLPAVASRLTKRVTPLDHSN